MSSLVPHLVVSTHDDILELGYLHNGRRLIALHLDGTLRVWNLENGPQKGTLISVGHHQGLSSLAVIRDGTRIISGNVDGSIRVWNAELDAVLFEFWSYPETRSPKIAISPDDRLVAVAGVCQTAVIVTYYTMEGQQVYNPIKFGEKECIWCMSFSPNGGRLACGIQDGIRVFDVCSGTLVLGPLCCGHPIFCLLWSHNGSTLFSGASDGAIHCWDSTTGTQIEHPRRGHEGSVRSLSLSADGSTLASVSYDGVRFWNVTTGIPSPAGYLGHDVLVRDAWFCPTADFLATTVRSVGVHRAIYVWQLGAPQQDSIKSQFTITRPATFPVSPTQANQTIPELHSACLPADERVVSLDHSTATHLTAGDGASSGLSHLSFTSVQTGEPHHEAFALNANFHSTLDLTHHISRVDDQYVAGGGFGDVYRCWYHGDPPKEVAVKAFRFTFAIDGDVNDRCLKMVRRELGIWRRLNHDNIVPFMGIAYGFGMRGAMSLVSLWMPNESLHRFLIKHDEFLGSKHRLQFLLDVANGLNYLHSLHIVHGDLNCNNVLLDANYTARLADFGYASLIGNIPEVLAYLQRSTARPGALRWIAPEQVDPESEEAFTRTTKSDIYSFGCIALQVLSGKQPWSEVREDSAVVLRLVKGYKPGRPASRMIDNAHWDLIQECWSSIEERPATEVIISTVRRFLHDCPPSRPLRDATS